MKTEVEHQSDVALKDRILQELKWEPMVNEAGIGVIVEDGVVTLTGNVPKWPERDAAERAARRVFGVKAIANDLEVRLPFDSERTDADLAREVANAVDLNTYVPRDRVKVSVHQGWVTLSGEVEWQFQKIAAETALRYLRGLKGTINTLTVKPRVSPADVKGKVVAALERQVLSDARGITVEAVDRKVTLRGKVRSWAEHDAVEQAAWSAPGVAEVENHVKVVYS
jgi:osmotically-inducible protein OsmY